MLWIGYFLLPQDGSGKAPTTALYSSEGEALADVFTIQNNAEGFDRLLQTIRRCTRPEDKIKVGLEATGHYSYNILGFLLDKGLPTYVINPLHTNLYRKSLSLRKTKTDRVDARTIAAMLMSDVDLKSYTDTAYHNEELKSLTRYRFDKVRERARYGNNTSGCRQMFCRLCHASQVSGIAAYDPPDPRTQCRN